ncbi:hypothetical protein ACFL25_00015 [Patescibacteria group bacterium]
MQNKKIRLVVLIELIIATLFIIGAKWTTPEIYILYQSYYADVFLPFGFYFLLTINDKNKYFNTWWKRSLAVFALTAASETLQYFGIYALARVFDPLDFVMYALGVLLAAFFDKKIIVKIFSFWN